MRPALLGISGAVEVPQPQPLGSLRAAKERPRWWRARFPGPSVFSQPIHPPGGLRSHPVTPVRAQDVSTGRVERVPLFSCDFQKTWDHLDFKNSGKARPLLFTLATRRLAAGKIPDNSIHGGSKI
jgi:hypothetical protein